MKDEIKKVIFLDIDGVLCTLRAQYAYGERLLMESWDITCCQMIRRLCAANGYGIVVSSVWRRHESTRLYLSMYGLIDYVHEDWRTPLIKGNRFRGIEVREWLQKHPKVQEYIIVDDDQDFFKYQHKRLIFVDDNYNGFSVSNFEKADKLMGGKFHDYMLRRKKRDRRTFNFDKIVG